MSHGLAKTIAHIEYEHNRSMFKNLHDDNLAIGRSVILIFLHVDIHYIIYLKSGPKSGGKWGH